MLSLYYSQDTIFFSLWPLLSKEKKERQKKDKEEKKKQTEDDQEKGEPQGSNA